MANEISSGTDVTVNIIEQAHVRQHTSQSKLSKLRFHHRKFDQEGTEVLAEQWSCHGTLDAKQMEILRKTEVVSVNVAYPVSLLYAST